MCERRRERLVAGYSQQILIGKLSAPDPNKAKQHAVILCCPLLSFLSSAFSLVFARV